MTHLPETEFAESYVKPWLEDRFGEDNVLAEVRLDGDDSRVECHYDTDRRADFIVHGPVSTWAIEAENDAEAIYEGVTQALLYAQHHPEWRPCVVTPPGHLDEPEASLLEPFVRIAELPPDAAPPASVGDEGGDGEAHADEH